MDKPEFRSALIGAGIALLLILIVGALTGGGAQAPQPAPAATSMVAPSPTLGPTVPAAPKAAP